MKKIIYLLLAMPLLFASCSHDDECGREDIVQVNFTTLLPEQIGTRTTGTLTVNKVVCAVFENGTEISNLRQEVDVTASGTIMFTPRLIQGRTYNIVFWAMKEGCYNVTDMTAITRASGTSAQEADYEAFTEHVEIQVTSAQSKTVTLKRPYAQLNLGITAEDWNAVASTTTFNMIPKKMVIKTRGKDTFNALTGAATGSEAEITRNLTVTGSDFTAGESTYKSIGSCYVYPEANQANFDITYTISTEDDKVIRENVQIQNVPLQTNYRTNIVGGLLTNTISYTITFDENFTADTNSTTP